MHEITTTQTRTNTRAPPARAPPSRSAPGKNGGLHRAPQHRRPRRSTARYDYNNARAAPRPLSPARDSTPPRGTGNIVRVEARARPGRPGISTGHRPASRPPACLFPSLCPYLGHRRLHEAWKPSEAEMQSSLQGRGRRGKRGVGGGTSRRAPSPLRAGSRQVTADVRRWHLLCIPYPTVVGLSATLIPWPWDE